MAAVLTLLLIVCLLHGALCQGAMVFIPRTLEVLSGSCVTIPCSFVIPADLEPNLDETCQAKWIQYDNNRVVFNHKNPQTSKINGELTGDLNKKDCTTTLNNMQPDYSKTYHFRLECNNPLKYSFRENNQILDISVKDAPPRPSLSPSTLKVKEGTSVNLTCSAPAPCPSHPPALTWTPGLGDGQESLQEKWDKTKVKLSVLTFTVSHLHHGKNISCTATYSKQDGSTESAVSSLTADISYSPKNTTVSVSPSGSVPEGRNVTLTCSSTANPPVRSYTWFRADGDQETPIGTRPVVNIKISKDNSLFFCTAENDIGPERSNLSLIDVQFAPQILPSSNCIQTASQLDCSCGTLGNPSPTLYWYLDGLPVNQSDKFVIRTLNDTGLRSILSVNQPQERDLSNLLCLSSNSLGSARQSFCVTSLQHEDALMLPVFISTVAVLLVLICALLCVIRAQKTHHNLVKSQCTGDTSTLTMSQLLTSVEGNEVPNTTEEDIYVNTNDLRQAGVTHHATVSEPNSKNLLGSGLNNAEGTNKSSEKKDEEGSDVTYSSVIWKSKSEKKGEDSVDRNWPGSSYMEEERHTVGNEKSMCRSFMSNALEMGNIYDSVAPRNVEMVGESEYAQVKFKK